MGNPPTKNRETDFSKGLPHREAGADFLPELARVMPRHFRRRQPAFEGSRHFIPLPAKFPFPAWRGIEILRLSYHDTGLSTTAAQAGSYSTVSPGNACWCSFLSSARSSEPPAIQRAVHALSAFSASMRAFAASGVEN